MWKIGFLVTVLHWRPFHAEVLFFGFGTYILLLFILFIIIFEKIFLREIIYFERNYLFNFFCIPMLHLALFFIYRPDYSFGSGKKMAIQWKILALFREPFLIQPFLVSTFKPQEALNKWTGQHITEERAKNKKMTKSYLCINL